MVKATLLATVGLSAYISAADAQALSQQESQPAVERPAEASAATTAAAESGDIVVTAQRRSENLSRVPISITAATQAELDVKGFRNIGDIARDTPGLNFRSDNELDQPNISIRGITSVVGSATTGVYVDDTPISSRYVAYYAGFTAFPQLFDLDRVEVLRGPQGTLFGAGSEGGTIRFITPKPSLTTYSGYGRADLGFTEHGKPSWEIGGAVGGPIVTDTLGFRASLWTRTEGGFVDRVDRPTGVTTDKDLNKLTAVVARASLLWQPTERLSLTPSFFYQRRKSDDKAVSFIDAGEFKTYYRIPQPAADKQMIGSLTATYDADIATITSVTSYYNRRQDRTDDYTYSDFVYSGGVAYTDKLPNYFNATMTDTFQDTWSQELRATTSGSGPLSATAGVFFMTSKTGFQQDGPDSQLESLTQEIYGASVEQVYGFPLLADGSAYYDREVQRDREYAGFIDLTYQLTDRLKISAGGRYSHTTFRLRIDRDGPVAGGPFGIRRSGGSDPVTPRINVSYQLDRSLIYGTVSKGVRVGGGNSSVANVPFCAGDLALLGSKDIPANYAPDSVWSYEVGAKTQIGRRSRLSGSAFWINWDKIQTNIVLPGCGYNFTSNGGKARSRGFDVQGSFEVLRGLTLSGTLGYTDARFRRDVGLGGTLVVSKGTRLSTPEWTGSAAAQYDFAISSTTTAYARADYQYNSSYTRGYSPGDISYDGPINDVGALNFVTVRSGVRLRGMDLSIYVNNLLNERPTLSLYHELKGSEEFRKITLRPRTIGATATYRF